MGVWGAPWGSLENTERRIELFVCCCFSPCDVTCHTLCVKRPNKDNLIVFTVIVAVAQLYVGATKKMHVVCLGYRQIA